MDKKQMYHIGAEVVGLAGVALYITKINKDLTKQNEALIKRITDVENILKIFNENFAHLVETVDENSHILHNKPSKVDCSDGVCKVNNDENCSGGVCPIPNLNNLNNSQNSSSIPIHPPPPQTSQLPQNTPTNISKPQQPQSPPRDEHFTNLDELDDELKNELNELNELNKPDEKPQQTQDNQNDLNNDDEYNNIFTVEEIDDEETTTIQEE